MTLLRCCHMLMLLFDVYCAERARHFTPPQSYAAPREPIFADFTPPFFSLLFASLVSDTRLLRRAHTAACRHAAVYACRRHILALLLPAAAHDVSPPRH